MNCPQCRHVNAPERNFCGSCGFALASFCPRCGFRNLAADRFCGGCGAGIAAADRPAAPAPRPEPLSPPAGPSPAPDDGALAELLQAAQEASRAEAEPEDVRVSQDDIDALFGE